MARGKIEKRGQRRRKIKPVILIVTEGSQTEPKYFEHYRNRQTNIDIRVVGSRTSGGETDYLSLIRKAVEYQNKNQISVSEGDSVWVVADGDVNYNNPDPITAKDSLLSKARKMADAKGIQIALSNPCFEFWYLLHFQYTTKFFKDYPAVKNALTNYLPDYEKAGDVYNQLRVRFSSVGCGIHRHRSVCVEVVPLAIDLLPAAGKHHSGGLDQPVPLLVIGEPAFHRLPAPVIAPLAAVILLPSVCGLRVNDDLHEPPQDCGDLGAGWRFPWCQTYFHSSRPECPPTA